jgi:hypothetical protein
MAVTVKSGAWCEDAADVSRTCCHCLPASQHRNVQHRTEAISPTSSVAHLLVVTFVTGHRADGTVLWTSESIVAVALASRYRLILMPELPASDTGIGHVR